MKILKEIQENNPYLVFNTIIILENNVSGKLITIDGNKTNYIITKDGRVINIKTGHEKKPYINNKNYFIVSIDYDQSPIKYTIMLIHRLLAMAFIENPENKPIINHKDGVKTNNNLDNLEWCTYSENNKHAFDTGLKNPTKKDSETCNFTQYTKEDVIKVCELLSKGYYPKDIASKLNIGYWFIIHIRRKSTWKEITTNYKFPICKKCSKIFSIQEIIEIEKYAKEGLSVREIIDKMNWEFDEKLRGNVKHLVYKVRKGSTLVFYI